MVCEERRIPMTPKFLAFDIETATEAAGDDFDWHTQRPLGIACAAALPSDAETPHLWHGVTNEGQPAPRLTRQEARKLLRDLVDMVADGYTLVTWNGLGFDLEVLAEESGELARCRDLARAHVDLMFHLFCVKGFPVALERAAMALGISGKPAGMSGILAPQRWAAGQYQEVLDYVAQDVRITLQVAELCQQRRRFRWVTRKGAVTTMDLPQGWLTVDQAFRLPEPDTSWMSHRIPRHRFTQWLED
jgi:hypothetical protein